MKLSIHIDKLAIERNILTPKERDEAQNRIIQAYKPIILRMAKNGLNSDEIMFLGLN